ncbi:helix-turn-helix transcriptional regulator [Acidovorax soli]|uniref:Helix-turn-helix domain-containing protein n=1 Tax=Acidovorax soli TaxID=592050 RepID=A0A1H4B6M1_9BURK|nr:helix-turn-helix domain-containing protein [Acidovorax soli]SEA43736.1 Helix-turn-helix domain-containing protein [Acidovorax soli]
MATPAAIEVELINFVEALAPSAKLTPKEAGAFLRVSQSTLERWRRDGSGPEYIQSGGQGARGTNQAVRYRKQSLIDWEAAHTVKSSMQAAIRKGQM